jgi:hypothetical protein
VAVEKNAVIADAAVNGAAMAAVLGAGIGSFAMGAFVLANEAGIYTAPALYGPAGGLSGRSTFAVAVWLVAWAVLHARWRGGAVAAGPVFVWTLVLIATAAVALFPPVWGLVS